MHIPRFIAHAKSTPTGESVTTGQWL